MRSLGLSSFFTWRPTTVGQEIGATSKAAKVAAVGGGVATSRTHSAKVDLPSGLADNEEAKARMEVMLALAQSGQFNGYADMLKSQTAKIESTSNQAKVYSDQMTDLIGSLNDMQAQQDAQAPQSSTPMLGASASTAPSNASTQTNNVKTTSDIWAATIANYTASSSSSSSSMLGATQHVQETQSDLVKSLTSAGMQKDVANDVSAALACSTHLAATMTAADPAESETVRTIPHDSTDCANQVVSATMNRLPTELQGKLDSERSHVENVLATMHAQVHSEVVSQVAKSNLNNMVTDRVRKLLDQTPQIADTAKADEDEARLEAQHLAEVRQHDRVNKQELATARQNQDDRARSAT